LREGSGAPSFERRPGAHSPRGTDGQGSTSRSPESDGNPDDDRAAERDRRERAQKAVSKKRQRIHASATSSKAIATAATTRATPVLRNQKRKRVQDASQERADPGDRAAEIRFAAAGQVAGVGETLQKAMLTPAPIAVARPAKNA
jgi:hypothetical protein